MASNLQHNSLISTIKLAGTNYYTVFTPTKVLVCDGKVKQKSYGMERMLDLSNWNMKIPTV